MQLEEGAQRGTDDPLEGYKLTTPAGTEPSGGSIAKAFRCLVLALGELKENAGLAGWDAGEGVT